MTHFLINWKKGNHMTDIYQTVTNNIIEAIEAGQTADKYQAPWSGVSVMPENVASGNLYRGVNVISLWVHQAVSGFDSGVWGTYKQWKEQGAQVKKGEKGTRVVFWKALDVEPEGDDEEQNIRMFAKWTTVFNAAQVEGYTGKAVAPVMGGGECIEEAEQFVAATGADIRRDDLRAYYRPAEDYIALPDKTVFTDTATSTATECYYSTLLHELTHWSGAAHRLDRSQSGKRSDYAFEELIAELGAAMMCAMLGITSETRADHAQYIDGWLKALKDDRRFIFAAASQA